MRIHARQWRQHPAERRLGFGAHPRESIRVSAGDNGSVIANRCCNRAQLRPTVLVVASGIKVEVGDRDAAPPMVTADELADDRLLHVYAAGVHALPERHGIEERERPQGQPLQAKAGAVIHYCEARCGRVCGDGKAAARLRRSRHAQRRRRALRQLGLHAHRLLELLLAPLLV